MICPKSWHYLEVKFVMIHLKTWPSSVKQLLMSMFLFISLKKCCFGVSTFLKVVLCMGILQASQYIAPLWLLPWCVSCVSHPWVCTQGRAVWWAAALWKFSWGKKCHCKSTNLRHYVKHIFTQYTFKTVSFDEGIFVLTELYIKHSGLAQLI